MAGETHRVYLITSCQRSGFLWDVSLLYSLLFLMEGNAYGASGYNHLMRRFSLPYIYVGYDTSASSLRGNFYPTAMCSLQREATCSILIKKCSRRVIFLKNLYWMVAETYFTVLLKYLLRKVYLDYVYKLINFWLNTFNKNVQ